MTQILYQMLVNNMTKLTRLMISSNFHMLIQIPLINNLRLSKSLTQIITLNNSIKICLSMKTNLMEANLRQVDLVSNGLRSQAQLELLLNHTPLMEMKRRIKAKSQAICARARILRRATTPTISPWHRTTMNQSKASRTFPRCRILIRALWVHLSSKRARLEKVDRTKREVTVASKVE